MVEALTGQRLGPGAAPTDRLPPPFGAVAGRALADDPRQRFASATEMLHALRAPANGTPQATRPPVTASAPTDRAAPAGRPAPRSSPHRHSADAATATPPAGPGPSPTPRLGCCRSRWPSARPASSSSHGTLRPTAPTNPVVQRTMRPARRPGRSPVRARHRPPTPRARPFRRSPHRWRTEGSPETVRWPAPSRPRPPNPSGQGGRPRPSRRSHSPGCCSTEAASRRGQYQDVVTVLQPTGATVTTTTAPPAPAQPQPLHSADLRGSWSRPPWPRGRRGRPGMSTFSLV